MSVGDSLRRLGRFLDDCERREGVSVRPSTVAVTGAGARANVDVRVGLDGGSGPAVGLGESTLDADGGLALTVETAGGVLPTAHEGVDVELSTVTLDGDGVAATATASVGEVSSAGGSPPARPGADADVPLFDDTERLAALYAEHDTFAEMATAAETDVSGETVRRYMIDGGVHEPSSYDTGTGAASASPTGATADTADTADGSETAPRTATDGGRKSAGAADDPPESLPTLPDGVTVDRVVDAVDTAGTIREVGRALDVDRMEAFELLREFDLIEFVMGSLAPDADRDASPDRIPTGSTGRRPRGSAGGRSSAAGDGA